MVAPLVGVLALQGAFAAHASIIESLGVDTIEVRTKEQLEVVDALVMPGGESTTMSMLLERSGMLEPLHYRLGDGLAVLGTCAGMILLSVDVLDGRADQHSLAAIDLTVRRNGYGRQIASFEVDLDILGMDAPFHAVFIRAPVVERAGPGVEILAMVDEQPVLCREGVVTVAAFHPELAGDDRLHRRWLVDAGLISI